MYQETSFSSAHLWTGVGEALPMDGGKLKANPSCHAPTHFIQAFYSELVFILDFHVLFHVIR
jgi:hypothetical protein